MSSSDDNASRSPSAVAPPDLCLFWLLEAVPAALLVMTCEQHRIHTKIRHDDRDVIISRLLFMPLGGISSGRRRRGEPKEGQRRHRRLYPRSHARIYYFVVSVFPFFIFLLRCGCFTFLLIFYKNKILQFRLITWKVLCPFPGLQETSGAPHLFRGESACNG